MNPGFNWLVRFSVARKGAVVLALALMTGCGAPEEVEQTETEYAEESDIGELEQEYKTAISNSGASAALHAIKSGFGGKVVCRGNQSASSQCYFRDTRSITFCVNPTGWTNTAERAAVRDALAPNVAAMLAQANTFTLPSGVSAWSMSTRSAGTACQPSDVKVVKQSLGGFSGDSMENYVELLISTTTTTVTETLPGTFKAMQGSSPPTIRLDAADIIARDGLTGILMAHAVSMGAAYAMGVGSSGANNGTALQQTAAPIAGFVSFTSGQACRLQKFNTNVSTDYTTGPVNECPE